MLKRIVTFVVIACIGVFVLLLQFAILNFAVKFNSKLRLSSRGERRVNTFVFLKTHKTASGTLTCIFSRYADIKNLQIAIPMKEMSRFSWPTPFTADEVDIARLRKEKANVLLHHAVFRYKPEFEKVMFPGAKFITIIRNPIDRFESQFFFDKFDKLFPDNNAENVLLSFLNARKDGWKLNMTFEQKEILRLFTNGMLFDLTGEKLDENTPNENFDVLIKEIEGDFDFILITEYFDESLVLLRKAFGWTFLDIVYRKKHVRSVQHKHLITEEVRDKIMEINKGDVQLYNHFLNIFERRLKSYGKSMNRHLEIFRRLNAEINSHCKDERAIISIEKLEDSLQKFHLTKEEIRLVGDFSTLSKCFCSQIFRDEVSYIKYFRKKFEQYYFITHKSLPKAFC